MNAKSWILAERDETACRIRCEHRHDAQLLSDFLRSRFPHSKIVGPQVGVDDATQCIVATFDEEATPFLVRQALLECPAVSTVRPYEVRVVEQPHYRIEAYNLAAWLDDQEEEPWWTVDGDPLLMSRLEFPAPPDELASELQKINRPLLAAARSHSATGEELAASEVDQAVLSDASGNRMLVLAWEGGTTDWQLIEDEPTSEGSSE